MNEVLKAISERFSCRDFSDRMPKDEDLNAITQAAIQAPSGMNRQLWQVILVKNKDLLNEMDAEGMSVLSQMEDQSMYQRILSRGGKLFYNAPTMVLIAIKEAPHKGAELVDCGILAQNISLAATSLGLGNLHCGLAGLAFAGNKGEEFKSRLKFLEGYECGLSVLVGYANTTVAPHTLNQEKITIIE